MKKQMNHKKRKLKNLMVPLEISEKLIEESKHRSK